MYERLLKEADSTVTICIGSVDCFKIQMCRLDALGSNQRTF